jgi:methyl-accepting chemotaxis protein
LHAISVRGAKLSAQTEGFAAKEGGGLPAEQVVRGVEQATQLLRDHVAQERETAEAMGGVVETVKGIATHVRDIQGIGNAVKIMALNALVETERAGDGGRVLAVLAQGMGGLAAEVVRRTTEVSCSLQEISDLSGALAMKTSVAEVDQGEVIASSLETLASQVSHYRRQLQGGVADLHRESLALRQEVDGIALQVSAQLAAAECLVELQGQLEALADEAAARAGPEAEMPTPVRRRGAYARYTMEAERIIHDRTVRGGNLAPVSGGPPSDMGNNVELF